MAGCLGRPLGSWQDLVLRDHEVPGVQLRVGHAVPWLGVDVGDSVDLVLGVAHNQVVITPVIREPGNDQFVRNV